MKRPPIAFSSLTIRSMPGFRNAGFAVPDLCPGINVLYGPNGVGKSTTARSILSLLWPKVAPDKSSLLGRFCADGEEWLIDLDAGLIRYQRQGAEATQPRLPSEEARDRYYLALHNLLASTDATADNTALAEAILRESAGGYDIKRAAAELSFVKTPGRPQKQALELRSARSDYEKVLNRQKELSGDEERLAGLYNELREAEEAMQRKVLLEKACDYHAALRSWQLAEQEFRSFPEWMGRLDGTEIDTLKQCQDQLVQRREEALQQISILRDARRRRENAGLPPQGVPEATLETLRSRLEELKSLAYKADSQREKALNADVKVKECGERIQQEITPEQLQCLDREGINHLATLAREADGLRAETLACESLQRWWGQANPSADISVLQEAISLLQRWLASPEGEGDIPATWRWVATLGGIFAVINALLLALFLNGFWLLLALPGMGVVIWTWLPRAVINRRADIQREYARLPVESPLEWTQVVVEQHLRMLTDRLAAEKVEQEKAIRWQGLFERYEGLQARQRQYEARRQELLARFGVAFGADGQEPAPLFSLADNLLRWREAREAASEAWQSYKESQAKQKEILNQINMTLAEFGMPIAADAVEAEAQIHALEQRNRVQREAIRDLHQARERLRGTIFPQRREAKKRYAALFRRLGLTVGDEATLYECVERLAAYRQVEEKRRQAHWHKEALTRELGNRPELLSRPLEKLQSELQSICNQAARRDALLREINRIETLIGEAKKGADIEQAYAQLLKAQQNLRNEREERCGQAVGWVLAEFLAQETHDATRPRVFHRARELFAKITQGRYRLEFEEDQLPRFKAIDTTTGISHPLDELSTGTRLQLLLSVRVAFVEEKEQESEFRLPLILDEALANSDEQRARALIEAIIAICREGRQVFYFTAQYDEVGKWVGLLQNCPDIPHHVVDMAALRQWSEVERLPRVVEMLDLPHIPAPGNRTYEEYGRILGVPGFDPGMEDIGATHLWHLLDDTATLYQLLQANVSTWGQLRTLYEIGGHNLIGEETYRRAEAAARVLEVAADCWQVGRGKPVDNATLIDSQAISERFLPAVAELARKVKGDAAQLLYNLEHGAIPHFRQDACKRLRSYLIEHHYLDESEPLTREQILPQALAVAADDMQAGRLTRERVKVLVAKLPP